MLAGANAGGVGVFLWIDYLKGLVTDKSKVFGVSDSSISMNEYNITEFYDNLMSMNNYAIAAEELPKKSLNAANQIIVKNIFI